MQNSSHIIRSITLASFLVLAGCSFPGVHKIDIQQGNVVNQEMVDQLRPGMTPRQVRFIMGTPLIIDTFHNQRWDYLYSIQVAGGVRQQERISLVFNEDNQLQGLTGDFVPGISRDQAILGETTSSAVSEAPSAVTVSDEATEEVAQPIVPGSLQEQLQREVDEIEMAPVPESRLKDGEL